MPVSMIVGFYYGICDLNLLLQGNHTRTWYLAELVDGFSKIPFAKMPVVVIVVYRILPQLLILLVFVMIIQHTIGSMREDAYRIAELTYRKEVDSSTRLYNKNKYEDMLANYYTRVERVAVVLWDINNLKEINDRMGHGMGDKLIETMSGAIYAQTDSRKRHIVSVGMNLSCSSKIRRNRRQSRSSRMSGTNLQDTGKKAVSGFRVQPVQRRETESIS